MDTKSIVKDILLLVEDENGFLVNLRVFNHLNKDEYLQILQKLNQYYQLIEQKSDVDRTIARSIYLLVVTMMGHLHYLDSTSLAFREAKAMLDELIVLMNKLLMINKPI